MFTTSSWPHGGHRSSFGFCGWRGWRHGRGSCGGAGGPRGGFGWGEAREHFMRGGRGGGGPADDPFDGGPGGAFGVRRPLRFLAHKLGLDERQIGELARILDELKTERAQAAVDDRRTLGEFADAIAGEAFDAAKATAAGERRVASAARLRDALAKALGQIHAILNPEQRARLAYLIRTGVLAV
jgi:Spy/CpxP family protein refolding chaperone